MTKSLKLGTGALVTCALVTRYWSSNSPEKLAETSGIQAENSQGLVGENTSDLKAEDRRSSQSGKTDLSTSALARQDKSKVDDVALPQGLKRPKFMYAEKMNEFVQIKAKLFPSQEEIRRRQALLSDAQFLRSLEEVLKTPTEVGEDELQASAIEVLIAALASPNGKPVAEEVMRAVIADPMMENPGLDIRHRETLAGNKGEILYHWLAADPKKLTEIRSLIPGPASEKLLQNVRAVQDRNLAESTYELRSPANSDD